MSKLRLSFVCGPYDRTQSLRDGSIQVEGVDLNYVNMQPAEIFWRQLQYQEFDASEMSLSNYTSLVSTGKPPFIAIPVYPSRVFRHGYFFINTGSGIKTPADLKGKRVALDEPGSGTLVNARAILAAYGIKESEIRPEYIKPGQAADKLKDGTLDAFFFTGGAPAGAIAELASAGGGIDILAIEGKEADALRADVQRETERADVGEHVARVGEEREAAGPEAGHQLDQHERARERQRERQDRT